MFDTKFCVCLAIWLLLPACVFPSLGLVLPGQSAASLCPLPLPLSLAFLILPSEPGL